MTFKTIKENGIKVYKNYKCNCICNKRIPFPINKMTQYKHELYGVPKYISGHNRKGKHNTTGHNKKISESKIGNTNGFTTENQSGNKNFNWKGNDVEISAMHEYIRKRKPKPKFCEYCKKRKSYDLANISGEYKRDINDFEWLCRKCHMTKDARILNLKQYNKPKSEM